MEKIYSDINHPAGLASVEKLYKAVKKINPKIKINEVKTFLASKPSYTLHKVTKKRFPRRKNLFKESGHTIIADIAYFNPYKKLNKNYYLFLIDGYSRYLTIIPVNDIKSSTLVPVLEDFFKKNIYKYSKIFSDQGVEFQNNNIKKMYKRLNLCWYTTFNKDIKASIVERCILTIKRKIAKYITHSNKEFFLDVLNKIVNTYNMTPHKGLLNKTPIDIHLLYKWSDIRKHSKAIYKTHLKHLKSVGKKLSKGEVVRIRSDRKTFFRGYNIQNTYELFRIDKVNENHIPVTYSLSELDGNKIKEIFYKEELIVVKDSGFYEISILKKKNKK